MTFDQLWEKYTKQREREKYRGVEYAPDSMILVIRAAMLEAYHEGDACGLARGYDDGERGVAYMY